MEEAVPGGAALSLIVLLCFVVSDFLYCAHIRHRTAAQAQIGSGTTLAEVVQLLGQPDLKEQMEQVDF